MGRLKQTARATLARAGIEVRRTNAGGPRRTVTSVLAHARALGVNPASLLDVGVAAGTPDLYAAFPGVPLLLVEPLAEHEPHLQRWCAQRPGSAYAITAAGPQRGSLEIAVHRVPALSSVLGDREGGTMPRRTVPVTPLDDLVAAHAMPRPHVLKIDVEGAELHVLQGASDTLQHTELVLLEVSFFRFVPGGAQLADVIAWMQAHGWSAYDVYQGDIRPLDGALAQLDIAFARDDGPLRADHRYATEAQLDALYRRWGY